MKHFLFFISEGYNQQQIRSSSRRAWLRRPRNGRVQGGNRAAFATPSWVPSRK